MSPEERGVMIVATMHLMEKIYLKLDSTTKMDLGCLNDVELRDEYEYWKKEAKLL